MKTRLFITLLAFVAAGTIATAQKREEQQEQTKAQQEQQAQQQEQQQQYWRPGRGRQAGNLFIDTNDNGICDHFEDGTRMGRRPYSAGANQQAANRGPGIGLGRGAATLPGERYAVPAGARPGMGRGAAMTGGRGVGRGAAMTGGRGVGRGPAMTRPGGGRYFGRGPAFIDLNNNEICDYLEAATEAVAAAEAGK